MTKSRTYLVAMPLFLGLTGCGTFSVEQNKQALDQAEGQGSEFTQELTNQYREFTAFEVDQMYDWVDGNYFAEKGLHVSQGNVIAPETLENWNLPEDKRPELEEARLQLTQVLDGGAREAVPASAAEAQAKFDCWVEQQEENHQPAHIAACRDQFWAALRGTEQAMASEETQAAVEPAAGPQVPKEYLVFFDFDSDELTSAADDILTQASSQLNSASISRIEIEGHADRAGPPSYNDSLSDRRAETVARYLVGSGVSKELIETKSFGETEPLVETADGIAEPANRRVKISFQE